MLTVGKMLDGRYHIREQIGDGGFGAVYLAEDIRFTGKNLVAVKEIHPNGEDQIKFLRQEADLLYNLSHPNLPKVSNSFEENGAYFIVMDYISGEDLSQKLKRGVKFEVAEVLQIAETVLDALEYLHSFPIFHRDIKPHNIKIDGSGKIFLLDFGTAKGNTEDDTQTKAGQSITGFTPFYAPLEQVLRVDTNSFLILQADHENHLQRFLDYRTDERSDVYALGATIFHLLGGVSPSNATSTFRARALWAGQPEPLPSLSAINPKVSAAISRIVAQALAVEPQQRFQTARDFRAALKTAETSAASDQTVSFADEYLLNASVSLENNLSDKPPLITDSLNFADVTIRSDPAYSGENFQNESKAKIEIPANEENKPLSEIAPLPNPKSGGKKLFAFGGAAVLILLLLASAGLGVWFLAGNKKSEPANINLPATVVPTAAPFASPAEIPAAARSVDYSLLVQKMRDGREYQEPFESSGQEIFENGYKFQVRLTASEDGFIYLFDEGLNDKGEKIFQIIFPTPARNNGAADVKKEQKIESGWNRFGGKAGTENFWLVWSKSKPESVEQARENAFASSIGAVTDKTVERNLSEFLEELKKNDTKVSKDVENKSSVISFRGNSAAYLLQLEHR